MDLKHLALLSLASHAGINELVSLPLSLRVNQLPKRSEQAQAKVPGSLHTVVGLFGPKDFLHHLV